MFLILSTLLLPTLISPINGDSQIGINSSTMKLSQNSTGNKLINDHGMNRQQGHHLHKRQNSDYKVNVKRNSDSSKSVFSDKQHLYYVNNAVNSNNYETANFHVNRRGNEFQSYNNMGEMVIDKSSYDPSGYHKLTTHDPSFDDNIKRNITIPQGGTAFLQCKINHLGDRAVSWVRQKDLHILTSGRDTYTSDSRFRSINLPNSNEWTLEIRDTRLSDSGIYECQLSTDPKMSTSVYLSVIALKTVITQGANLYLKKGANINLTCLINYIPDPESNSLIIWQHSDQIINYDSNGRGAKLTSSQLSSPSGNKLMISNLLINSATTSDAGNYTCRLTSTSLPSHYAKPALTHVHVLNGGENPAAMQGGATSTSERLKCASHPHGSSLFCRFAGIVNYFYLSSMVPMLITWFLIR